jgi:hypothetical protein
MFFVSSADGFFPSSAEAPDQAKAITAAARMKVLWGNLHRFLRLKPEDVQPARQGDFLPLSEHKRDQRPIRAVPEWPSFLTHRTVEPLRVSL